jgi:hypothetical protein
LAPPEIHVGHTCSKHRLKEGQHQQRMLPAPLA